MAWLIIILNIVDIVCTLYAVSMGLAVEANPLMGYVLEIGAALFTTTKGILVALGVYVLHINREKPLAQLGLYLSFLVYTYIITIHFNGLILTRM